MTGTRSDVSAVVVDSDVVSFILRGDSRAERYRTHLEGRLLAISFMTVAELRYGALVRRWGDERLRFLEQQMRRYVIHPYDVTLCGEWAEVTYACRRAGRPVSCADAWIAATARQHGVPLVTHNAEHYAAIPRLTIITEAKEPE